MDKSNEIEINDIDQIGRQVSKVHKSHSYEATNFQKFDKFYLDMDDWNAITYLDQDNVNRVNKC